MDDTIAKASCAGYSTRLSANNQGTRMILGGGGGGETIKAPSLPLHPLPLQRPISARRETAAAAGRWAIDWSLALFTGCVFKRVGCVF